MQLNIAIDIETTATVPTAGVWDLGIVVWERGSHPDNGRVKLSRAMRPSGVVDGDTIDWIFGQDELVVNRFVEATERSQHAREVLPRAFTTLQNSIYLEYGGKDKEAAKLINCDWYSWGQFDFPILHNQFQMFGMPCPWHFRKINCFRSVMNAQPECSAFYGARPVVQKPAHRAFFDAVALADLVHGYQLTIDSAVF